MPLCSEMITDEDIYDYIVVNLPGINKMLQSNPDVCIQKVDDQWLVAHSRLPDDRDFIQFLSCMGLWIHQALMR